MPNTGRASRDCHTCRQRRVKCDLGRPECTRCLRFGRPCPGYRDELAMRFRNESVSSFASNTNRDCRRMRTQEGTTPILIETPRTTAIAHTRREDNSIIPSEEDHPRLCTNPSDQQVVGFQSSSEQHSLLLHRVAEYWNDHVIPLVLNKVSVDIVDEQVNSMFHTIPRVIRKAEHGSAIYEICNAIGLAYLSRTTWLPNGPVSRAMAYGTALRAINSALRDPVQCSEDSTLLAAELFIIYESLMNPQYRSAHSADGFQTVEAHSRGLITLIRLRGAKQFVSQDGWNLAWFACYCTQSNALIAGRESLPVILTWIEQMYPHCEPSEYFKVRTYIFVYHCNRLCSRIKRLVNVSDLDQLLSNSPSILRDIDELEQMIPHPFSDYRPITDLIIHPPLAPYTVLPEQASLDNVCLNACQCYFRMHVSSNALTFLVHASQAPECTPQQRNLFTELQGRYIAEFRALANKTLLLRHQTYQMGCSAQPVSQKELITRTTEHRSLGWANAIMVYGSLRTIAMCPISLAWQKDEACRSLILIEEQLGISFPTWRRDSK